MANNKVDEKVIEEAAETVKVIADVVPVIPKGVKIGGVVVLGLAAGTAIGLGVKALYNKLKGAGDVIKTVADSVADAGENVVAE